MCSAGEKFGEFEQKQQSGLREKNYHIFKTN